MQLGTRWAGGTTPPRQVPADLHEAIADVEATAGTAGSWTLTFLEGRAIAEYDAGFEVFIEADGTVVARPFED